MIESIINYIYTRKIKVKRYSNLGDVHYEISYRKYDDMYKLIEISVKLCKLESSVFDFTNDLNVIQYDDKVKFTKETTKIADISLCHSLYLKFGLDLNIFDSKSELVEHRITTNNLI